MKKIILLPILAIFMALPAFAQRIIYVDSDYILASIPEYAEAQKKLDAISEEWRAEIDRRYKEIDELYKAYQAEQVILPDATKVQRQQEIENKEKAVKEYQKQKFGYEGELFKKKQEFVKPIQDKIYNEIQKLAVEKSVDIVLDKASGTSVLYYNPKLDRSDDIILALGYKPVKTEKKQ
ncbi:MAG: OmpH family outer membrane protein [Chitinophagales bacterium]|nr:OmpH family outer membrane protein [Chitinophagales bacterium]